MLIKSEKYEGQTDKMWIIHSPQVILLHTGYLVLHLEVRTPRGALLSQPPLAGEKYTTDLQFRKRHWNKCAAGLCEDCWCPHVNCPPSPYTIPLSNIHTNQHTGMFCCATCWCALSRGSWGCDTVGWLWRPPGNTSQEEQAPIYLNKKHSSWLSGRCLSLCGNPQAWTLGKSTVIKDRWRKGLRRRKWVTQRQKSTQGKKGALLLIGFSSCLVLQGNETTKPWQPLNLLILTKWH